MKRVAIVWNVGSDENGKPILKRQNLNVPDVVTVEDARVLIAILDKYSKYEVLDGEIIVTESVGDHL